MSRYICHVHIGSVYAMKKLRYMCVFIDLALISRCIPHCVL